MKKQSALKRALIGLAAITVLGLITGLGYCWWLSGHIEDRFAHRRWRIPSKVYSDATLLYPGQQFNRDLLAAKLKNLGYRVLTRPARRKGEVQMRPGQWTLFLNDLNLGDQQQSGFAARIRWDLDVIRSIRRVDNGRSLAYITLEPEEIMNFFGHEREQRHLVSYAQVPEHLVHAVLAAEDHRFFNHHGVDPKGVLRALFTNLRHGSIRQGGSTITQQLAKNYFLTPKRTLSRKFKELLIALTLESMYTKPQILELYLNEIYLGQKGSVAVNGVGEAARFYFGKDVSALNVSDAAALAGLIKGPNAYSPYRNRKRCRKRRNLVLAAMLKKKWITAEAFEQARNTAIVPVGYRAYRSKAPYFIDYLARQLPAIYSKDVLAAQGLQIHTTLDTMVQKAAEAALQKGLQRLEETLPQLKQTEPARQLQGAVVVMQPKTGNILALVGGRSYSQSQFNRITQARRQPGSTFKPFVYLSSLAQFTPATLLSNEPKTYLIDGRPWEPRNPNPEADLCLTMRQALSQSANLATVDLAMQTGLDRIVATASQLNFSTPLKPFPSIALGAFEVIPLELARAYSVLAAEGYQPHLLSLKEIFDEHGKALEKRHMQMAQLVSPEKTFILNSMLHSAVMHGTGRRLRDYDISVPVAGKTGTTNDYRDAWFVGFTPDLLALVWVGFDNGDSLFTTGSGAALPIWAELIKAIPHRLSGSWYRQPPGVVKRRICALTGQRASRFGCPVTLEDFFLAGTEPVEKCPVHSGFGLFNRLVEGIDDVLEFE